MAQKSNIQKMIDDIDREIAEMNTSIERLQLTRKRLDDNEKQRQAKAAEKKAEKKDRNRQAV